MSNDSNRRNHSYATNNNNNTTGQLVQLPPQVQQYFGSSEELPGNLKKQFQRCRFPPGTHFFRKINNDEHS